MMFFRKKKKKVPGPPPRGARGIVRQGDDGVPPPPPRRGAKGIHHTASAPAIPSTRPRRKVPKPTRSVAQMSTAVVYNRQGVTTSNRPTAPNQTPARSFVAGRGNRGNDASWIDHRKQNEVVTLADGRLAESDARVMGNRQAKTYNNGRDTGPAVITARGTQRGYGGDFRAQKKHAMPADMQTAPSLLRRMPWERDTIKPSSNSAKSVAASNTRRRRSSSGVGRVLGGVGGGAPPPVPSRKKPPPAVPSRRGGGGSSSHSSNNNRFGGGGGAPAVPSRKKAPPRPARRDKAPPRPSRGDKSWRRGNEVVTLADGHLAESDAKVMGQRAPRRVGRLEDRYTGGGGGGGSGGGGIYESRGQQSGYGAHVTQPKKHERMFEGGPSGFRKLPWEK